MRSRSLSDVAEEPDTDTLSRTAVYTIILGLVAIVAVVSNSCAAAMTPVPSAATAPARGSK